MFKRQHYIVLGLVGLLTLLVLNLSDRTTARIKQGLSSLFLPLVGFSSATQQAASNAGDALVPRRELLRQIQDLQRENQDLRVQLNRTDAILKENERFRRLFGWQQQHPWKLKLASVVLREPANWWRTVQIDVGSRNGVRTNMPVLAPDGALVGRIASVSLTTSQVMLLGDQNCKVAARVENETRDTGVIGVSGPLESEFVEMGYLSGGANLKAGQRVLTSGDGGIFPPNILIGQVVDSRSVEYGLATVARVKLAADLSSLEEVWVKME